VISDSLFLPMNEAYQRHFFNVWDFCSTSLVPSAYAADCRTRSFTTVDLFHIVLANHPTVQFAVVTSKRDAVARDLYNDYNVYYAGVPAITSDQFVAKIIRAMEPLNDHPNFLVFLITSVQHLYFSKSRLYTATENGDVSALGTLLHTWLASFHNTEAGDRVISSMCADSDCGSVLLPKSVVVRSAPQPSVAPSSSPAPTSVCPPGKFCFAFNIDRE
jgi:hypothetical protein